MENLEEIKAMIQGELALIGDMEERRAFKELMEGVFLALWETNAGMYKKLEERVIGELAWDMNRFCIRTGLAERESFDPGHRFLAPAWEDWFPPPIRPGSLGSASGRRAASAWPQSSSSAARGSSKAFSTTVPAVPAGSWPGRNTPWTSFWSRPAGIWNAWSSSTTCL